MVRILCTDSRFVDKSAFFPGYLGIPAVEIEHIKTRTNGIPEEIIRATVDHWISLRGDTATIRSLYDVLEKQNYDALKGKSAAKDMENISNQILV